jgi:hypothetical protein
MRGRLSYPAITDSRMPTGSEFPPLWQGLGESEVCRGGGVDNFIEVVICCSQAEVEFFLRDGAIQGRHKCLPPRFAKA